MPGRFPGHEGVVDQRAEIIQLVSQSAEALPSLSNVRVADEDSAAEHTESISVNDARPKTTAEIFPRIRHAHPHGPASDRIRPHTSAFSEIP